MPIGKFARACRLSVKALRHYDEERLLRPAHVDERTGYRYYTREQVRDAVTIGMLRGLGIGIPIIRRFLAGAATERTAILQSEAQRIEQEMSQRRFALDTIARFGATGALAPYEVAIRQMQPLHVAERCVVTNAEALIVDTTALIYSLFDELRAAGRDIVSPVFCMNDDSASEEHIVVHACVRVVAPFPELPQARIVDVPGGEFATVMHVGPYEELGLAYHALYAWAQEHGHEPRGLIREIYVNDPANVRPEALQTEVLLPL
jgi:DNA-binding transcriptional MerR regulator/predicted transcriptional regulator YdeE